MKKICLFLLCLTLTISSVFVAENIDTAKAAVSPVQKELLRDNSFKTSFTTTVNGNVSNNLGNGNAVTDCWYYDQYNSSFALSPSTYYTDNGTRVYYASNEKKLFVNSSEKFVYLYTDTSYDYSGDRTSSQPSVSNVLRQKIINNIPINKMQNFNLNTSFCIMEYGDYNQNFDPALHTIQLQIVLTVKNLNKDSSGYGDYFVYALPIYDARYSCPPAYNNGANGGDANKKYICNVAGNSFLPATIQNGQFYNISVNLSQQLNSVFNDARSLQYLTSSTWADMYVDDFSIVESVPGSYKIGCYFKDLSLGYQVSTENAHLDSNYSKGFGVYTTQEGNGTIVGNLKKDNSSDTPIWNLAQWNSVNNIAQGYRSITDELWLWGDNSKQVFIRPETNTLGLLMNASSEYTADRQANQPWPALIVSQEFDFDHDIKISEISSLYMDVDYRITKMEDHHIGTPNLGLHAAQLLWYITVQNRNENSSDFGKYIWFGLQLYDSRYTFCPGYADVDGGKDINTGMFIYLPAMTKYHQQQVNVNTSNSISYNAYQEILTAFDMVKAQGYLPNTTFDDLYIGGMNIGWELPGTYDVCAEIDNLNLYPIY